MSAHAVSVYYYGAVSATISKKRLGSVGSGRPTGVKRVLVLPVAIQPPVPPVLRARVNATTTHADSLLIIVTLLVYVGRRALREHLDPGAPNNLFRESFVSMHKPASRFTRDLAKFSSIYHMKYHTAYRDANFRCRIRLTIFAATTIGD